MAIKIDYQLTPQQLGPRIERLFGLSAGKILGVEQSWASRNGAPVFTVKGRYTARTWTEWTQGFQFGSALLQFDATGDKRFLEIGRTRTVEAMAPHVSHIGVHDHGFNNLSTYGNLLRLMREGKIAFHKREQDFYQLALKVSGAVQAARWSPVLDGTGFIYSFNGPQSLFIDTMRSLRSLAMAHRLGHVLMGEQDRKISLLDRLLQHAVNTARFSVYYGARRDAYDVRGRVAHESLFNPNDGAYRCPSSQQGYSPFTTWTRGLAWAIVGFAEQMEFLGTVSDTELEAAWSGQSRKAPRLTRPPDPPLVKGPPANAIRNLMVGAATATADFYLENACADGIPMWDTGAPNLHRLPDDYLSKPADPFNAWEPVDSSAAAIAAQGLLRLGRCLARKRNEKVGARYRQAGLTVARTIFSEPYLSSDPKHQGLLLHSVYHRPKGWDYIAPGQKVPNGESSMWGDYHARELALLLWREARGESYLTFYGPVASCREESRAGT